MAALPCIMAQCISVDSEWVTAGDIAETIPRYASVEPEVHLVRAPFPGARRVVGPASLPPLEGAAAEGITPFCVERRLRILTRDEVGDAVGNALGGKDDHKISFELVDYDRSMVPSGRIEFVTGALPPPVSGRGAEAVLWRGKLFYAEGHSVPVWVRIKLWVEGEVCLLRRDVGRGEDLAPEDCKLAKTKYPPFAPSPLHDSSALLRTVAARRMKAEELMYQALVVHKPDVESGKVVEMRVINGAAQVRFQAKAASSGRRGDSVIVTNPVTGKRIEGQVTGQGSVEVRLK